MFRAMRPQNRKYGSWTLREVKTEEGIVESQPENMRDALELLEIYAALEAHAKSKNNNNTTSNNSSNNKHTLTTILHCDLYGTYTCR